MCIMSRSCFTPEQFATFVTPYTGICTGINGECRIVGRFMCDTLVIGNKSTITTENVIFDVLDGTCPTLVGQSVLGRGSNKTVEYDYEKMRVRITRKSGETDHLDLVDKLDGVTHFSPPSTLLVNDLGNQSKLIKWATETIGVSIDTTCTENARKIVLVSTENEPESKSEFDVKHCQSRDKFIMKLAQAIKFKTPFEDSLDNSHPWFNRVTKVKKHLHVDSSTGLLHFRKNGRIKAHIPPDDVKHFVNRAHGQLAHAGRHRTEYALRSFWWPSKFADIKSFIRSCATCAKRKGLYGCGAKQSGVNDKGRNHCRLVTRRPDQLRLDLGPIRDKTDSIGNEQSGGGDTPSQSEACVTPVKSSKPTKTSPAIDTGDDTSVTNNTNQLRPKRQRRQPQRYGTYASALRHPV